jgi:hypothetical protein
MMAKTPVTWTFTGVDKVKRNLADVMNISGEEVFSALYTEAWLIMGKAVLITPWDKGDLARSVTIKQSGRTAKHPLPATSPGRRKKLTSLSTRGNTLRVTMGFNTEYALFQHEDLHWDRIAKKAVKMKLKHRGRGEAKYLEKPLNAAAKGMSNRIANRLWRRWQKENFAK